MRLFHARMTAWVYILASKRRGTLHVGVASDLVRRIYEHREGFTAGPAPVRGI